MLRRPSAVLASALLVCLSCGPKKGPVAPDDGARGTGGGGSTQGMTPLAPITRAADVLPPDTLMVMDIAGPARIAEIIGRDALVKAFPKEYSEIVREMSKAVGADMLDPKELAKIGVDIKGRIGIAVLGVKPLTMGFYWSLSDAGRFRQFTVDTVRRQGQEVISVPMSGAEVIRIEGERVALVLRDPIAMFVIQDGGEAKGDPAMQIATADPNLALANDREYRKAIGGLAPADWMTYLDAGTMWQLARGDERQEKPTSSNWARDELAQAKANGASAERIAELERQIPEVDEQNKRWERREKAERELLEKIIGGTGRTVWTVSAKPGGLVGEGQLELGADALVMKAMRNHPGSPALPKALSGRPVVMFTGAMDPAEMLGIADLFMQAEGETLAELSAEMKKDLGIDIDTDLRPLITGTGGFALTLEGKLSGDSEHNAKQIGLAVDIELADATKASALLDKVAARATAELRKRKSKEFTVRRDKGAKAGSGWIVDVPKWRAVHVSIAGHHLVVSTDAGLAKRIEGGKPGTASELTQSAALAAASLPGAAFGGLLDIETLTLFGFGMRSNFGMASSVEDPESAKAPKSKAYKAKLRDVERARTEVTRMQERESAAEIAAWTAAVAPWGAIAGNVTEQSTGLLARGGLFVRSEGGIAGALLTSLTGVKALSDRRMSEDVSRAFEQLNRVQAEADEIRRKDVDAWRARQPKGKSKDVVPPPPVREPAR